MKAVALLLLALAASGAAHAAPDTAAANYYAPNYWFAKPSAASPCVGYNGVTGNDFGCIYGRARGQRNPLPNCDFPDGSSLQIVVGPGEHCVRIDAQTGKTYFGAAYDPDEMGLFFWEVVADHRPLGDEERATIKHALVCLDAKVLKGGNTWPSSDTCKRISLELRAMVKARGATGK